MKKIHSINGIPKNIKKLPDLPSKLIRLAISDLKKVMKDKNYKVNMYYYHKPDFLRDKKCMVSLEGCVMAKTLKVSRFRMYDATLFEEEISQKLKAIRCFSDGQIFIAFDWLEIDLKPGIPSSVAITKFEESKDKFICNMLSLANLLESKGL